MQQAALCCVGFSVMSGSSMRFRVSRANFGSRRQMENSPCREKGREKACIPRRIGSCAHTVPLTSCDKKIWQHGHETYLQSFTHGLHLQLSSNLCHSGHCKVSVVNNTFSVFYSFTLCTRDSVRLVHAAKKTPHSITQFLNRIGR